MSFGIEWPRMAAIGVLVALLPMLLTRAGRGFWPVIAGCALASFTLWMLLGGETPSYGLATMLGAAYAACVGCMAVLFGIFSLFSSNTGEMARAWLLAVLPLLLSALSAAAVVVLSVAAGGSVREGLGGTAHLVVLALTALLLIGPIGAILVNAGAILRNERWRRIPPELRLSALLSIPMSLGPALLRVGIPIALLWVVAWAFAALD
jgi:hypothetical protein